MPKSPLVSVIVPNYNHARYLDQRMESILNQTYRNIEVIILDDCSTDNSLEVIEKYRSDARIVDVIVNEKNSGNTFLQWNKGIHLAKGELVWIAESDDYCELNMLEELVKSILKKGNTVLAYTTSTYVDDEGIVLNKPHFGKSRNYSGKDFLKRYLSLTNVIANASSCIFSREAVLSVSSLYQTFKGAGDYLLWVELASKGRAAIVNKGLNQFRRHSGVVTERRYADGTNFIEEKIIYDRLTQIVHLSILRKKLAYSYHAWRISSTQFVNNTTSTTVNELWDTGKSRDYISRALFKMANVMRLRYDYFI